MGAVMKSATQVAGSLLVHPLEESQLDRADEVFRLAFGTFKGLPEPSTMFGSADYVRTRWTADPKAAFAATIDGKVVGSNFAMNWGSVGFFGPLSVHPDLWGRGVGQRLMEPIMDLFRTWGCRHLGLFTFSHSPQHIELYRRFGFWPRFLTAVMRKPVLGATGVPGRSSYSGLPVDAQPGCLSACRSLTEEVYDGLDLQREIVAVHSQALGDTVLLHDGSTLDAFAVCHCGAGTEAGEDACFVKFGAVRPGPGAAERFERLLDACQDLAAEHGLGQLDAGMNLGRPDAYGRMAARGFRAWILGVTMHRPNESGYSHPNSYVIDDWR
jgi:GNAT superfamily N-acetyltransferase